MDIKDYSFQSKIKVKKDYENKHFLNPYFPKNQLKSRFNTKLYLKVLAIIVVVYVLIYSDFLAIKKVTVTGLDMIKENEFNQVVSDNLKKWRWLVFPQKNFIFFSKGKLKQGIETSYNLESIAIKRGWKSLKIEVKEKISDLIVFNKENFYFADKEGRVTQDLAKERVVDYWQRFPILNIDNQGLKIGDNAANSQQVAFILALDEAVKKTNIERQGYELKEGKDIVLVSKTGWRAYFDYQGDLNLALENLLLVLKEKIKEPQRVEYIDLRFGNKIFYK